MKMIVRTFQVLFLIFVVWFIGLFFQLPIIPWIETDYILTGTNQKFSDGIVLTQKNEVELKIEIPNEFNEENQCFDTWFKSKKGNHNLTVKNISIKAVDNKNGDIRPINSYLFWDNGSKDETFEIRNYELSQSDTIENEKYVFFRTVINANKYDNFSVNVKANFEIDNRTDSLNKILTINKKKRLTWNKFRVH